jgi:dynein heavy chain
LNRIEQLYALLSAPPFLSNSHICEADDAAVVYEQVSSVLDAYQKQIHSEWVAYLETQQAIVPLDQRLEQPLLIRASANGGASDPSSATVAGGSVLGDSRIEGNFDKVLLRVFQEVQYWAAFKGSDFSIPYIAQDLSRQHEMMRILRENVMFVVRDYNAVIDVPGGAAIVCRSHAKRWPANHARPDQTHVV